MSWLGASILGLLCFSFLEYVHHRHAGHLRWFGRRLFDAHMAHHRDPREGGVSFPEKMRQRAPLVVVLSVALFLLAWPWGGVAHAVVFTKAAVLGYVYSEWFHHTMHHRAPRTRFERWMWLHHYAHHFADANANYGFTSPLWDYVFGTRNNITRVVVPDAQLPGPSELFTGVSLRSEVAAARRRGRPPPSAQ